MIFVFSFLKYELVMPPWWKFEYDNVISYADQDIIEELNRGY